MTGNFQSNMYGSPNPHTHILITLCLQYGSAGGQPLRLRSLRLGYGCELWDYNTNPVGTPHYLNNLTNLAHLEELHLEDLHQKDGSNCPQLGRQHGYTLLSSKWYPNGRRLTGLRKMTFPWSAGALLIFLRNSCPAHLRRIVLRIDKPAPSDWVCGHGAHPRSSRTWAQRFRLNSKFNRQLTLGGLVLPTEFMTPQDGDNFLTFVPWVKPMRALKIRMPPITGPGKLKSYMRTFWNRMSRMTELQHLWFADGLGTWYQVPGEQGSYIDELYPSEEEFDNLATKLAHKCACLRYLRILNRAWKIARPDGEHGQPVLRQLAVWQVEKDLPDAFFWGVPTMS